MNDIKAELTQPSSRSFFQLPPEGQELNPLSLSRVCRMCRRSSALCVGPHSGGLGWSQTKDCFIDKADLFLSLRRRRPNSPNPRKKLGTNGRDLFGWRFGFPYSCSRSPPSLFSGLRRTERTEAKEGRGRTDGTLQGLGRGCPHWPAATVDVML